MHVWYRYVTARRRAVLGVLYLCSSDNAESPVFCSVTATLPITCPLLPGGEGSTLIPDTSLVPGTAHHSSRQGSASVPCPAHRRPALSPSFDIPATSGGPGQTGNGGGNSAALGLAAPLGPAEERTHGGRFPPPAAALRGAARGPAPRAARGCARAGAAAPPPRECGCHVSRGVTVRFRVSGAHGGAGFSRGPARPPPHPTPPHRPSCGRCGRGAGGNGEPGAGAAAAAGPGGRRAGPRPS